IAAERDLFGLNRWILMGSLLIALLLPTLKVPAGWSLQPAAAKTEAAPTPVEAPSLTSAEGTTLSMPTPSTNQVATSEEAARASNQSIISHLATLSTSKWLLIIYLLGVGVFSIAFIIQVLIVLRKRRNLLSFKDGVSTIYELTDDTPPFSFGNWIFIHPGKYDPETFEQILAHEKLHVSQGHTLDKLLAELVVILCWFNPFAWLLRSAITKNLEYLTDAEMLNAGSNPTAYQLSLVKVSVPQYGLNPTNNYNESFLKKRVTMMNTKKSSAKSSWKYLLLLPILMLSVVTLNGQLAEPAMDQEIAMADDANDEEVNKPITMAKEATETGAAVMPPPPSGWEKTHKETITREYDLGGASRASEQLLTVHNITGAINVEGYNGKTIKVTIEKIVQANSDRDLQKGIQEVQLGEDQQKDQLSLYLNTPFTTFDSADNSFAANDCGGKNCHNYQYFLHYRIQVPRAMSLTLSTINGGDIIVNATRSRSIMARHISNSVYLRDVTGVKEVFTVSGHIEVDFHENPTGPTSFVTTSGHVKLDVVDRDFGAKVNYSSISGDLITSFPVVKRRKDTFLTSGGPVTIG
ncbi:MAG: M56 family metallopeptidase, partial [Bacteroidota bacterium]